MDRIKDFPQDGGLWWVRWVDNVQIPAGGTGSPSISVMLCRLDDGTSLDRPPEIAIEGERSDVLQRVCRVLVGMIPGLTIGTVFRNGWRVGRLDAPEKTLMFTAGSHEPSIWPASSRGPFPTPSWWRPEYRQVVLPKSRYWLGDFHAANCLIVHDENASVVIPCFEVFRAFYAPQQEIALALLSGPWETRWSEVANPDTTGVLVDGTWKIGLRKEIRNECAQTLANLILNPWGREAANSIYLSLLEARQRRKPGFIRASLPFEWDRLELRVRWIGLRGEPEKHFAFEVTGITWPDPPFGPPPTVRDRDNSNLPGDVQTEVGRPEPFIRKEKEVLTEEDGTVSVISCEDPDADPPAVIFGVTGPVWWNQPPMREADKSESYIYEKAPITTGGDPAHDVSPGNPGGTSNVGRTRYFAAPRPPSPHRFVAVVELFRRLKDAGAIQDWTVVHPPRDGIEFRGGIWAWPFMPGTKRKRSWCNLDGNQEHRRSALVCEVELDGAKMYWLEIETRPNEKKEAFKALLFGIGERDRTVTIEKLLRIAAARKGVWPECEILEKAVTAPVRKWQHRFEKAPTMQLVAKSAMKALYEIVVLAAVSKSDSE